MLVDEIRTWQQWAKRCQELEAEREALRQGLADWRVMHDRRVAENDALQARCEVHERMIADTETHFAECLAKWRETEEEREALRAMVDHQSRMIRAVGDDGIRLREECAALRAALRQYGEHQSPCDAESNDSEPCICGLDVLLAAPGG